MAPEQEVERWIQQREIWGLEFGRLATRIEFEGYADATRFASEVFDLADEHEVYPVVRVEEKAVEIDVGSDGDFTDEELSLAEEIEEKLKEIDWG